MSAFHASVRLPVPVEEAFAWHERPGAFARLLPPGSGVRVVERRGGIRDGDRLVMTVPCGPLRLRWEAEHRDFVAGRQFADEQVRGPFARWVHTHRFTPAAGDAAASVLDDHIDYRLPGGALGRLLAGRAVERKLERTFAIRHRRTVTDLVRHHRVADRPRLRIALSGAGGLVGSALAAFLGGGGHRVQALVRRAPRSGSDELAWDPAAERLEPATAAALAECDAVVHLAGHSVAAARWSAAQKAAIRDSRIGPTRRLAAALAGLPRRPAVLISASGTGYYGSRGDEELDEASAGGGDFLAGVCREWEDACAPARAAGMRVVALRTGMVLAADGGALAKLLTPFRLGLGGRVGAGRQWMSWIALDDLVGAIHHLLFADGVAGAVNATAPAPVANADFVRILGRALHRPALLPLPAAVVRMLFGEMGQALLLDGARVLPRVLQASGFEFLHADLAAALRAELGLE